MEDTKDPSKSLMIMEWCMGEPWGVGFQHYHHRAVGDNANHCVYIFNEQDELVRKVGSW